MGARAVSGVKGVQGVIYGGPGGSNFGIVPRGADAVRQQNEYPVGVRVAPKAGTRKAEMAETATSSKGPRGGLVGRFSVEACSQRTARALLEQWGKTLHFEPSGAPAPGLQ